MKSDQVALFEAVASEETIDWSTFDISAAERAAAQYRRLGAADSVPLPDTEWSAAHLAHAALVSLDLDVARISQAHLVSPSCPLVALASCFAALQTGAPFDALPKVSELESSRAVFDRVLFQVLAEDEDGDEALARVRRAARMARTEGDLDAVVIAGTLLARHRRLRGFPHLSLRILNKLEVKEPNRWDAWLAWEKLLSGGTEVGSPRTSPAWKNVQQLQERLRTGRWNGQPPHWRPWARDLARVDAATGVGPAVPELQPWLHGTMHIAPFGLVGLSDAARGEASAWVTSEGGGRRILRRGSAPPNQLITGAPRVDSAIAELILHHKKPTTAALFFQRLYGFEFIASRHRSALDVLLHRVRESLPAGATLHRGEVLWLELDNPLSTLDPRTIRGSEDVLLAAIAERDHSSARELANALGMPLRSVQRSLRAMAVSGQCLVSGRGAGTQYAVEDTTFTNPTGLGE